MFRLPDPVVVALVGAPGSGKSTWARARWPAPAILETDHYRELVCGDRMRQSATPAAIRRRDRDLVARLRGEQTTVLDSTHSEPAAREHMLDVVRPFGIPVFAVVVRAPEEECLARNAARPGEIRVPDDAVSRKWREVEASIPGLLGEGFTAVVTPDDLKT